MTNLDALTHDAGAAVRRARSRELGGAIVHHLFRLIKLAQMHSLDNQAFKTQVDTAAEAFTDYRLKANESVSLFFARGVVFFSGEPLKAPRSVYDAALELGEMLRRCGGADLSFAADVTAEDLRAFTVAVTRTLREPNTRFADFNMPRVRLRAVSDAARLRGLEVERLDEEARVVRTYASAIVVMRRLFEDLMRGDAAMPRRIKRIAQALVDLSSGRTPSFLGVTAVRNANHDDAGRAVNTAILAVAMARRLTDDRVALTRVAMSALLLDAGRPRALRALQIEDDGAAPLPAVLPDANEKSLPAGTVSVLTSLGRINEPTIVRSVVAYEALWHRRVPLLGQLYRGLRPPTLHARVVAFARAYNDLLTPLPGAPARSAAEALLQLEEEVTASKDRADRTVLRLLMAVVGQLPPGTLVQLSSGASAVVVHGEPMKLRILVEADGALPDGIRELGLGEEGTEIARIVGADPNYSRPQLRADTLPPPPTAVQNPAAIRAAAQAVAAQAAAAQASPASQAPPASLPRPPVSMRNMTQALPPTPMAMPAPPPQPPPAPPIVVQHDEPDDNAQTLAMNKPSMLAGLLRPSAAAAPPPAPAPSAPAPAAPSGAPAFSGNLQRSPFPHILINLVGRSLTGSLVLTDPDGIEHVVVFERGAPRKAQCQVAARRLGEILVARGLIDIASVESSARKAARKTLIGKQLVAEGKLSARDVVGALEAQIVERVSLLAAIVPETTYSFFSDEDLLGDQTALGNIDPFHVILATTRVWGDHQRMEETLRRLGNRPLALHPAATIGRFGLTEHEETLTRWVFECRLPFADIRETCGDNYPVLRDILYTLAVTRHLELGSSHWPMGVARSEDSVVSSMTSLTPSAITPLPSAMTPAPISVSRVVVSQGPSSSPAPASAHDSSPPSQRPSVPPTLPPSVRRPIEPVVSEVAPASAPPSSMRSTSTMRSTTTAQPSFERTSTPPPEPAPMHDDFEARRREISDRAASLESQNFYQILGLELGASTAEIQQSFLLSAKLFHPDRIPAQLADMRDTASKIFSAMVNAHRTLSDAAGRAAYDESLASGKTKAEEDAEQQEVERVLNASVSFQKAEILLRRNDLDGAEKLSQQAVDGDPQPEHMALRGWIHAQRGQLNEALKLLNAAVTASPNTEAILFYRGSVLKRLDRNREAFADFKRVIEINPKNLDATREVRLFQMRQAAPGAPPDSKEKPGTTPKPKEDDGLLGRFFGKKKSLRTTGDPQTPEGRAQRARARWRASERAAS